MNQCAPLKRAGASCPTTARQYHLHFPRGHSELQKVDFPHAASDRHGRWGMGTLYELDVVERPNVSEADSAVLPHFAKVSAEGSNRT